MNRVQRSLAVFFIAAAMVVPGIASAVFTQAEKMADYRQLVTMVEQNYAPLRWKQKTIGLDWAAHVEKYKDLVKKTSSDVEFYQTLAKFLAGLQDAHVSVSVPSTLQANLGFLSDYVEGKVLIEVINRKSLPEVLFPFKKGDELVAIGGVPVADLLKEIAQYTSTGYDLSSKRLGAAYLTFRRESRALPIPQGVTTVTVLPQGSDRPVTVSATWIIKGRSVLDVADFAPERDVIEARASLKETLAKLPLHNVALSRDKRADFAQAGIMDLGSPKSMFELPSDAVQLPMVPFTAVTFERNGKKIGILRLPEYGDDEFAMSVGMALAQLESKVDVLVLDQANNPGGQVSTVSTIMSFFAQSSVKDAMFAVRPSRGWLGRFQEINAMIEQMLTADPDDLAANALKARFQYLENLMWTSLESRTFLTEPFSLDLAGAMGMINPSDMIRFTKPILMLINEFDFSGGDVMPALLKDSGRAKLFGHRTSGAGGNVAEHGPLTNSGFKLSLTESLIVRPNGALIENLGVEPDVKYDVTKQDFLDGYKSYSRAFLCEAMKLVEGSCEGDLLAAPAPANPEPAPADGNGGGNGDGAPN